MREAFIVVLVSLFIVLSSGFIALPGVSEEYNESNTTDKNYTPETNLENNNKIDQDELYTNGNGDKNNVERSSVFINQKFRKQFRNQLYKILVPLTVHQPTLNTNLSKKLANIKNKPQKPFFVPNYVDSVNSRYTPIYQYEYPRKSVQYQEKDKHDSKNKVQDEGTKRVTQSRLENIIKVSPTEIRGEGDKDMFMFYKTSKSDVKSPSSKNKVRITSYTHRKSNTFKCGFPEPHLLHRSSFNNKIGTNLNKADNSFMSTHVSGLDAALTELSDAEDNIDKYIKDTLKDNGINDIVYEMNSLNDNGKLKRNDQKDKKY